MITICDERRHQKAVARIRREQAQAEARGQAPEVIYWGPAADCDLCDWSHR